jgi:crossover junction endodeoxyribonuclease RuvC
MRPVIGIDPGKSGAFAIIDDSGVTAEAFKFNGDELDVRFICEFIEPLNDPIVYLEKVHSMPKQGVKSTFTFGRGFGELIGMVKALQVPFVYVTPQAWKKKVLAGLDWKGNKKASIEYCVRKFPGMDLRRTDRSKIPHDGITDALCIAEYGKQLER